MGILNKYQPMCLTGQKKVRGATTAADNLNARPDEARLYKQLTTLRTDVPIETSLTSLEWRGVKREKFETLCDDLGFGRLADLPHRWSCGSRRFVALNQ
ncbi:MAG: hypothetical protein Ct9H300mP11_19560 [Chloroflexota bacterium]|nr:MAG: hypothetical protein Ct9H300mP11_19560 [Chloroflexota bacterium]